MEASINNIKKKPALFMIGRTWVQSTTLLEQMLDAHSEVAVFDRNVFGYDTLAFKYRKKSVTNGNVSAHRQLLLPPDNLSKTQLTFVWPGKQSEFRLQYLRTWYDTLIGVYHKEKSELVWETPE
ncbi:MAG: hypothetical protein IPI77_19335 [Saprospiraceae bacterium]|nr:hypothetical protein [Saprospiraceae bacterium]